MIRWQCINDQWQYTGFRNCKNRTSIVTIPINIMSGIRKTCMLIFHRNIFASSDFLSSWVTNRSNRITTLDITTNAEQWKLMHILIRNEFLRYKLTRQSNKCYRKRKMDSVCLRCFKLSNNSKSGDKFDSKYKMQ